MSTPHNGRLSGRVGWAGFGLLSTLAGTAAGHLVASLDRIDSSPVLATRPVDGADPGGALEVDLRVADARWLTRLVLRLAPYAEVLAPQEFTDSSVAAARATLGLYS